MAINSPADFPTFDIFRSFCQVHTKLCWVFSILVYGDVPVYCHLPWSGWEELDHHDDIPLKTQHSVGIIFLWSVVQPRTHIISNEHSSANLLCLPNGFVKNCLVSTHGECMKTNHHTVIGVEQISFDIRSIYPHPREHYRMRTKAFAVARLLLLYCPHIPF